MKNLNDEYRRLRNLGWPANQALRAARVNVRFAELEAAGLVRVKADPDECMTLEDLVGEGATKRQVAETEARANRDGVWVYVVEYLDPAEGWTVADAIGGFIGEDWNDSLYDVDGKEAAINAVDGLDVALVAGWV